MARGAMGFPCPKCKDAKKLKVLSEDIAHILELECKKCGTKWAVESAHYNPRHEFPKWMDKKGQAWT